MSKSMEHISISLKAKCLQAMCNALDKRRWKRAKFWFAQLEELYKRK